MLVFLRTHPHLGHLSISYYYTNLPEDQEEIPFYVPNPEIQLLKLKSLAVSSVMPSTKVNAFKFKS